METLALTVEWEIEDQLAHLVAQETKGTQEKMGSLAQMVPLVRLERLDKEGSWVCLVSEGSEACPGCLAQRAPQEK